MSNIAPTPITLPTHKVPITTNKKISSQRRRSVLLTYWTFKLIPLFPVFLRWLQTLCQLEWKKTYPKNSSLRGDVFCVLWWTTLTIHNVQLISHPVLRRIPCVLRHPNKKVSSHFPYYVVHIKFYAPNHAFFSFIFHVETSFFGTLVDRSEIYDTTH